MAWCNKQKTICFYIGIKANFGLINFSYCLEIQQVFLDLFMLLCTRRITFTFTFSHFADAFIQSDLQLGNT